MHQSKVWVTGAGGLIGHTLTRTAPDNWKAIGLTRESLNLLDGRAVIQRFGEDKPAAIIHCAAISKNPACEADPKLAQAMNVEATRTICQLAAEIPLIFFSTDLVFDGAKGAYLEHDPVNPRGVYPNTKAEAERIVLANPGHTVVRISLNGGVSPTGNRGFNEEMRLAWQSGRKLNLFIDEYRCPMAAEVTSRAVWELLAAGAPGTYHLCGAERLSRFQIGSLLAERHPQLAPQVEAGSLREYQGPPRSPDTSMNCGKIQRLLSFPLPRFTQWLSENPHQLF